MNTTVDATQKGKNQFTYYPNGIVKTSQEDFYKGGRLLKTLRFEYNSKGICRRCSRIVYYSSGTIQERREKFYNFGQQLRSTRTKFTPSGIQILQEENIFHQNGAISTFRDLWTGNTTLASAA